MNPVSGVALDNLKVSDNVAISEALTCRNESIYMNCETGLFTDVRMRKVDELVALGNSSTDEETRKSYYKELMELYMEDVPSVAMYAVINAIAHSDELTMEDAGLEQMALVHWAD